MNSFISIIVPTFNSEQTVIDCLNSIVNQQYLSKEVVIVDGDSHDKTIRIIKEYSGKYPYFKWISEKDLGIYDAMNKGISMANGDWLYFLGSDDTLFNENILSDINDFSSKNKNSKILYGNVQTSANYVQKYQKHTYSKLLNLNICHQAIFYHKSLFDNIKYELQYPVCSDWDFNLKVFRRKNAPVYIDKTIANYNLNGLSKNWFNHTDYVNNFKNKSNLILRHRSPFYLAYTNIMRGLTKIKNKLSRIYQWIFQ